MFKEYFMLLLLAHIIGDFYVQTDFISRKKKTNFGWVLLHCLFYWVVAMAVSLPVMSLETALFGTLSAAAHLAIDILKYFVGLKAAKMPATGKTERNIFFADQILHLAAMASVAFLFEAQGNELWVNDGAAEVLSVLGISAKSLLNWAVALFVVHKPVNIAISLLLTPYRPESKNEDLKPEGMKTEEAKPKDRSAGRFIGTLERLIILFLIYLNQYSAIGLVLTAKSIARYDKITKDPAFSEYYLLGTLLSTLAVIAVSFIL